MLKTIIVTNKVKQIMYSKLYTPFRWGAETAAAVPLRYYYIIIIYRGQYTYCTIYRVQVW